MSGLGIYHQRANEKDTEQTAQMHRLVCAFVCRQQSQVFSCQGPNGLTKTDIKPNLGPCPEYFIAIVNFI